jgi:trk system potassium uptake protein TrkH
MPRSHMAAKYILFIYLSLTLSGFLGFWLAGMTPFDAINHAMTSIATGGYSTSDSSLANWSQPAVHWVAVVLMICGGLPFTLYVATLRGNRKALFKDHQVRGFLGYWLAGMTPFDAINHAMTSIATGGYSTSDSSLANWNQPAVHWVAVVLMICGGLPFTLYVATLRGNRKALFKDHQVRGFLGFLLTTWLVFGTWLWLHSDNSWLDAFRIVAVNVTSVVTTTGYALGDYTTWGSFAVLLFFYLTFVGGCSGSTSGGLKIFRFQVAYVLLRANLQQLVHPRAVIKQQYNNHNLDEEIVRSLITFSFFFTITIGVIALGLTLLGLDWVTALTGAATAVCNVGPGLGPIIGPAGNFSSLPDAAKWLLTIGMLLGRLEILTVLVLITRAFWRH